MFWPFFLKSMGKEVCRSQDSPFPGALDIVVKGPLISYSILYPGSEVVDI